MTILHKSRIIIVRYVLDFVHTEGEFMFFQKKKVREETLWVKEQANRSKGVFFDKKYNR